MQVTFEEVSRLCFVVFSAAVIVCVAVSLFSSISTMQRWKTVLLLYVIWIYCEMRVPLRRIQNWSWRGFPLGSSSLLRRGEQSLTSFSSSQHMLAFMGFIYSTSQGSAKRGALWGDRVKERGGSGKHLRLFDGWRSDHQIARSRYWDAARYQFKTLWCPLILILEPLDWKQVLQHSTGCRCLFTPAPTG